MPNSARRFADRVAIDLDDGVAHVRLSRSEKLNSLDRAMFEGLVAAGEYLETLPGLRAVVLSGEGKGFSAGIDLSGFDPAAKGMPDQFELTKVLRRGANLPQLAVLIWRDVPVPVIAAVHGFALGGGFQISLGADMRLVHPSAKLGMLETQWGLVPDMGGVLLLHALVRPDVAADVTYSARTFLGEEALSLGIATRVSDDPVTDALQYARQLAGRSPDAIRAAKRLLAIGVDSALREKILLEEAREQIVLLASANHREAVAAGMARRAPLFAPAPV